MATSQQVAPPPGADAGYEDYLNKGGTTAAPPVRMPAGLKIRPQTGDPLQDAMNLQADLMGLVNDAQGDAGERQAAFAAYQATSDDVSRLMKERLASNEDVRQQIIKENAPPARPPEPTVSTTARTIPKWNEQKKVWEDIPNANYTPPAAPQGPAFSGTPEGMAYASQLRRDEAIAAGNTAADQYAASAKTRADELKLEAALRDISDRLNAADASAAKELEWTRGEPGRKETSALNQSAEARAVEQAKAQLAQAQAAEARASRQEKTQQNQAGAAQYNLQANAGMDIMNKATAAGVALAPGDYGALYFDPHRRALDLIAQEIAGPEFDPRRRALDLIGEQVQPQQPPQAPTVGAQAPRAPTIYDSNPSGSSMGGWPPRAPTIN